MAVSQYDRQTDRELAIGAANGDQRAFAALYDRYFAQIYDLAVRALRSPDVAADITQATFQQASSGLASGRVPEQVRAWLYSIAISEATLEARQAAAARQALDEQSQPSFIELDALRLAGVQGVAEDVGYRKLVWDSATQLSPREYALLDLSVRRDLSAAEIGAGLDISEETADATVAGVRQTFEQNTAAELLTLRGREHCPDLDGVLQRASAPDAWPQAEHAVAAHYGACEVCRATAASYPASTVVLGGFALVPAVAGVKEMTWANVVAAAPAVVVAASAVTPPPPPPSPAAAASGGEKQGRPIWLKLLLGAVGLLFAFAVPISIYLITNGGGDDEATVSNPKDIRAVGLDTGDSTPNNVIEMEWDKQDDVQAYSVEWSKNENTLPAESGNLTGQADRYASQPLDPGKWWFHIRTQGIDGSWTSPEHVGPYNIVAPTPEPTPEPTEKPTDAPTAPPTEKPTPPPTATPTPTPAPATATPATPTPGQLRAARR